MKLYKLLKELGMKLYKPYILDIKRPENAEEKLIKTLRKLKEAGYKIEDIVIGFFDESSPQISPNTARLWSFKRLKLRKITTKQGEKANAFGFYAINGKSVVCFEERTKKENVISAFGKINEIDYAMDSSQKQLFYQSARRLFPFVEYDDIEPESAGITPKSLC